MLSDNKRRRALSTAEVAAALDVAPNTVRNLVARGQLTPERLPDPPGRRGNMLFPWAAVVEFVATYRPSLELVHPDDSPPADG